MRLTSSAIIGGALAAMAACAQQPAAAPQPPVEPDGAEAPAWRCGAAPANDACRAFRPENARALHNTDMLYL